MKQSIGLTQTISIMVIFIVITFALLSATLSYYKAFRINSYITDIVQKYEGYNSLSENELTSRLTTFGYRKEQIECNETISKGSKKGTVVKSLGNRQHAYCIYEFEEKNGYFTYGVVTYIYIELPFNFSFRLPVYSETESIFHFSG